MAGIRPSGPGATPTQHGQHVPGVHPVGGEGLASRNNNFGIRLPIRELCLRRSAAEYFLILGLPASWHSCASAPSVRRAHSCASP